jgi:hypothetical protein
VITRSSQEFRRQRSDVRQPPSGIDPRVRQRSGKPCRRRSPIRSIGPDASVVKLSGMGFREQRTEDREQTGVLAAGVGRQCLFSDLCSLFSGAKSQARKARLGLSVSERVRAIRTGRLHALPRFHLRPIDVVVDHGSCDETWS